MRTLFTLAGALLLTATVASANTITVTPTPIIIGTGPYTWSYNVVLDGQSQINNEDFFTIFDFAGFTGTATTQPGWTFSSSNLGTCPAQDPFPVLCAVADDPTVPNLTWTRTGGTLTNPNSPGIFFLGAFTANSIYNETRNDFFASQDEDLQNGVVDEGAGGNTNVPTAPIPEPASLLLLGSGLAALAGARKRKTA